MKATFKINNDGTIKVLHTGETGKYTEGLAYSVNPLVNPDGGSCCAITGIGTFDGEELNIPPEIDGYKVTSISRYAFRGCTHLTSVTIPASVRSIGYCAFGDCFHLTSIDIPNGVRSIGDCAFYNCLSLESINIPNSVTGIGDDAFYNCSSLTSINIPDSVMDIGGRAFCDCSALESVTIPAKAVMNMGDNVFHNCDALESMTVTDSSVTGPTGTGKRFIDIPADAPFLKIKIEY